MKTLFDQGVPKPLQTHLPHHEVKRAFQLGWADKKNGELLALAEMRVLKSSRRPIKTFGINRTFMGER